MNLGKRGGDSVDERAAKSARLGDDDDDNEPDAGDEDDAEQVCSRGETFLP